MGQSHPCHLDVSRDFYLSASLWPAGVLAFCGAARFVTSISELAVLAGTIFHGKLPVVK
jgi:hypothetical protein